MSEAKFQEMAEQGEKYAKAKATRIYLSEFRKSKKAILMSQYAVANPSSKLNQQEREAYAHSEYLELLEGLKIAVENEEAAKNELDVLKMRFEQWKENGYNKRAEMKLR